MSSSNHAVRVRGLGKQYTIRKGQAAESTLAETLIRRARNPLARPETDTFWALKDIDFDIMKGDVVGIIGRNGAGKSTLLKVLSQITEPTTGEIRLYGRVGSLLEVGTGFHPELTGRENIFLNGAILGMTRGEIKRQFDAIVEFSGVDRFLDTPVKRYSSGMYVRLAFAVAAHLETEILVVDEVLAVGDAEFQKKCIGKMQEVASGGRTVLFVSHNMNSVKTLCNSGICLAAGRVVTVGTVAEAIHTYLDRGGSEDAAEWNREETAPARPLEFQKITCKLEGQQPRITLKLQLTTRSRQEHAPAFIAFDLLDSTGTSIMQAIPTLDRVLSYASGERDFEVGIDLPPLIPGNYSVTVWAGPHNSETLDEVRNAVNFTIFDSPTKGRTFPHTVDHGHVVPESRILSLK